MTRRILAAAVTAAALTLPAAAPAAVAEPVTMELLRVPSGGVRAAGYQVRFLATPPRSLAVKPAKGAAKAAWRGMSPSARRYHCYHFRADRAEYGRGYRLGARLAGKSPRRARALWLGWAWQLNRKCPR